MPRVSSRGVRRRTKQTGGAAAGAWRNGGGLQGHHCGWDRGRYGPHFLPSLIRMPCHALPCPALPCFATSAEFHSFCRRCLEPLSPPPPAESRERRGAASRERRGAASREQRGAERREYGGAKSREMSRDLHPSAVSSRVQTKGPYEVCLMSIIIIIL